MPSDLQDQLTRASGQASQEPDVERAIRQGDRLRRRRRVGIGLTTVVAIVTVVGVATGTWERVGQSELPPIGDVEAPRDDTQGEGAAVLQHELEEHALWASEAEEAEEAAAEFLEQVLGWSTDPVRLEDQSGGQLEEGPESSNATPPVTVEAESPDGQSVLLELSRGEPQSPFPGEDIEPSADGHWRVSLVMAGMGATLRLDADRTALEVHHVPEEQDRSVVLLYAGGESSTHVLDGDEVEPGATDEIELSALGLEDLEHAEVELEGAGPEVVSLTALVVHLDEEGRALAAEGARIVDPTGGSENLG